MKNDLQIIDPQNISKVIKDFKTGDSTLSGITNSVTIFGSARTKEDSIYYEKAVELGYLLSEKGLNVITGGGPGIMEAANKGAFKSGKSESIGLGITLPFEDSNNEFITKGETFEFFFSRKTMLVKYSKSYVVFPGGFGSLDELFETLTLMQTGRVKRSPIYLFGVEFWSPLMDFINKSIISNSYISKEDLNLIIITDDVKSISDNISKI